MNFYVIVFFISAFSVFNNALPNNAIILEQEIDNYYLVMKANVYADDVRVAVIPCSFFKESAECSLSARDFQFAENLWQTVCATCQEKNIPYYPINAVSKRHQPNRYPLPHITPEAAQTPCSIILEQSLFCVGAFFVHKEIFSLCTPAHYLIAQPEELNTHKVVDEFDYEFSCEEENEIALCLEQEKEVSQLTIYAREVGAFILVRSLEFKDYITKKWSGFSSYFAGYHAAGK